MRTIVDCSTGEVTVIPSTEEEILEEAWGKLRSERNGRLASSDWTQVSDAPVNKEAWAIYRQALRDLPNNTIDPLNVIWPDTP